MAASGRFSRGQVVIAPIPYALAPTGTMSGKLRPALVIASLSRDDLLVCQITSQPAEDSYDVTLTNTDFAQGTLRRDSTIRASRLFVIRGDSPVTVAGKLTETKFQEVVDAVVRLVRAA